MAKFNCSKEHRVFTLFLKSDNASSVMTAHITNKRENAMLKQSTAVAILLLTLPASASALDNSTQNFLNGSSNSLRGVDTQPEGDDRAKFKTMKEFSTGIQAGGAQANPLIPVLPWLKTEKDKDCDGRSVRDFMSGKCNKLYGIDSTGSRDLLLRGPNPPSWGADEFVDTEGFTQSGAPYQQLPWGSVHSIKENLERRVIERLKDPQVEQKRSAPMNGDEGSFFGSPNLRFVPFEPKRK